MTVQDSGKRSLYFSQWMRDQLPLSSTGTYITDIDFVITNWKTHHKILLVEEKMYNTNMTKTQFKTYMRIKDGLRKAGINAAFVCIKFEKSTFDDGRVWANDILVTEEDVKTMFNNYT